MTRRISALTPVYNGAPYLAAALDSMLAELDLTQDELIVVDDGSTDTTPDILARYADRITVLSQHNSGGATALNRGLAVARGEFITFNDADDLWQPGRIAAQQAALDSDPSLGVVFGMSLQFVSDELSDELKQRFAPPVELMSGEAITCMLARRTSFDRVGRFDETMPVTFVYQWIAAMKALGVSSRMLPDVVLRRRLHETNWSRLNRDQLKADALRALRQQVLRKREAKPQG